MAFSGSQFGASSNSLSLISVCSVVERLSAPCGKGRASSVRWKLTLMVVTTEEEIFGIRNSKAKSLP